MATVDVFYNNPRTGASWPVEEPIWQAPDDGEYVNLTPGSGLARSDIRSDASGLWRYRKAIRLR